MWIRRLTVRHWRGLDFETDELSPHLNLVFGPNEAGKSRLVQAMRFALFESSSGRSQHKKELATWGSTEKPQVTLEFELGGDQWRLQKTFLATGCNTSLRGPNESLEGEAAEERLAQLIGVGQGGRKAVGAEDLGIWSLLWVEQGDSRDAPAHNEVSQARIQDQLTREIGEVAAGEVGQDVLRRAEQLRYEYYTAARDTERSQLTEPRALVAELTEHLQAARADRDAVAATADELDRQRAAERDLQTRVADAQTRFEDTQALEQNARELGQRLDLAEAEVRTSEGERNRCAERLERAQGLEKDLDALAQRIEKAAAGLTRADAERHTAHDAFEEANKLTTEADQQHAAAERRVGTLLRQQERTRLGTEAKALRENLRDADRVAQRIAAIQQELAELPGVSAADVERIREAYRTRDAAAARLEGAAASIELLGHQDLTVGGEPLARGTPRRVMVQDEQRLEVDGILSITVHPGAGELPRLRDEKQAAERSLAQLLEAHAVESASHAERVAERRRDLEAELERGHTELERILPDGREHAETTLRAIEGRLTRDAGDNGSEAFAVDTLDAAQAALQEAATQRDEARARREAASERLSKAREASATASAELKSLQRQADEARTRREALPGKPGLQAELDDADRTWRQRVVARDALEQEFEAVGGADIELDLEQAARAHEQLKEELRDTQNACIRLTATLEAAGNDGRHEKVQELEAELADAEAQLARVERQADAARRLHQVLQEEYEQARERLAAPVIARIRPYLQSLFPNTEVWLDEDLNLKGLRSRDTDQDFEALSGGAREQLSLLVRVGLAEVLGSEEPHPLVLDDALVNTDADRIRLVQRVLYQASRRMQILLFTCHEPLFDTLGADARIGLSGQRETR